jgi:hypothetical protein
MLEIFQPFLRAVVFQDRAGGDLLQIPGILLLPRLEQKSVKAHASA